MNTPNGIVLDGKFYEAKKGENCGKCDLRDKYCSVDLCTYFDAHTSDISIFRLNKKITKRLNGGLPTRDTKTNNSN